MSRLLQLTALLAFLACVQGCDVTPEKGDKKVPKQDAAEARKLLVGKWEGEWGGVPRGFEFMEGGKGFYLTRMTEQEERADGKPVKLAVTFKVPKDNWLEVE